MKTNSCDKEQTVVSALLTGTLPDDVRAHVSVCEECAEVMLVAQSLWQEVIPALGELYLPDASRVWRRAQAFARQRAIAKATQPIRVARIAAYVTAVIAMPWAILTFLNSAPTFVRHLWKPDRPLSDALTGTIPLGIAACLIFVSLSSWFVLRQE